MYTYNIVKDSKTQKITVNILRDNDIILSQDFNPSNGKDFTTENEAKAWAESYIEEIKLMEAATEENKASDIYLEVSYQDENGNKLTLVKPGTPIYVSVELYKEVDGQKQYIPLTGKYVVPYYKDNLMVGAALIEIKDGKGVGKISITEPGIYTIKLDKVLNAETMKQPSPLPIFKEDPVLVVADDITAKTTSTTNTTDTTTQQ